MGLDQASEASLLHTKSCQVHSQQRTCFPNTYLYTKVRGEKSENTNKTRLNIERLITKQSVDATMGRTSVYQVVPRELPWTTKINQAQYGNYFPTNISLVLQPFSPNKYKLTMQFTQKLLISMASLHPSKILKPIGEQSNRFSYSLNLRVPITI